MNIWCLASEYAKFECLLNWICHISAGVILLMYVLVFIIIVFILPG